MRDSHSRPGSLLGQGWESRGLVAWVPTRHSWPLTSLHVRLLASLSMDASVEYPSPHPMHPVISEV